MVHSKHGLKESLSSLSTTELESQAVELWKVWYLPYSILYSRIISFVQRITVRFKLVKVRPFDATNRTIYCFEKKNDVH